MDFELSRTWSRRDSPPVGAGTIINFFSILKDGKESGMKETGQSLELLCFVFFFDWLKFLLLELLHLCRVLWRRFINVCITCTWTGNVFITVGDRDNWAGGGLYIRSRTTGLDHQYIGRPGRKSLSKKNADFMSKKEFIPREFNETKFCNRSSV